MNVQATVDRIKAILLNPKSEWVTIKSEEKTNKDLLLYYALPLAVLAAATAFIQYLSYSAIGFGYGLRMMIYQVAMPLVAIVVASYVLNELAEKFNSRKNLNNAFKLVTYSYTPGLLAAIVANLSWTLSWVGLFGLYGIYLFWIGLTEMMETPDDKKVLYALTAALIIFVINIVITALFGLNRAGYL